MNLLEVVCEQVLAGGGILSPVVDDHTRGLDHLDGVTLSIDLAEASPLAELHLVFDGHDWDSVLGAKRLDQLLVRSLGTVVGQDAKLFAPLVEVLCALTDAADQTVVADGALHHVLECGDLVPAFDWLVEYGLCLSIDHLFLILDVHDTSPRKMCFLLVPPC